MPIVCKKPKCVLSKDKTKCIKPNPYVQFISHCGKLGKTSDECKEEYYKKSTEIKKKACDYYESNKKVGNIKSCPKARRPVNNKCPDDFPVMKTNKHNVKCCYKETTKKPPAKKVKKVTSISSDDIPIIQLKRKRKVITPPFESAESSKKESIMTPFESAESSKKGKRTSTPFKSAESSKKGKRTSTPFESAESSKKGKRTSTPFESAESSKKGKRTSTPFESAESVKSSEKKEEVNPFKMDNKIYKLAKVQKYKGRRIPVKVIKHKFPKHKIDEVLRELEKPRKMASLTQSSPIKGMRKAISRKTISAPSKIKYLQDQEQGWFDWIRGKRNKPPSKVIDNELNKKIEKIYRQESAKRHREMYPDKYAKKLTRKEIELLIQADVMKEKKRAKTPSLIKKVKERRLSDPNLKFKKPQKKGLFDWFKAKQPAPMIDNELNKRIEMVKRHESDKRHKEMYPDKYAKNLTRKEIELLKEADVKRTKSVKPTSASFSFGNKAKNRYEGHMSAPESISLNKGQLKVSVPSLDPKAKKYFDDKLMKKIEEIKAKVPPKKQKGWFQKLFGNESGSTSEKNKNKKKWYEY